MAHEITIDKDGFAEAAFSLTPAWHGLGTVFDHVMTSKEALTAARLDWRVVQRQVGVLMNEEATDYASQVWVPQPDLRANIREDTGLMMGAVSDHYQVVQNTEAFEFLDALVDNHEMRYESAFSLNGGRRVVVLARMPGVQEVVAGDALLPYVLMSLTHDGTGAVRFGPVSTRVVCANTYAIALGEGTTREMSIRHSGNIKHKLAEARNILGVASNRFAQYAEVSQALARVKLDRQQWLAYLDIMCPEINPLDPDYTDRRAEAIIDTRLAIMGAYSNERQLLPGMERTAWAAYCAVSEHIDHLPRRGGTRERKAEARFNVCLFGTGRDMKERAFQAACKVANVQLSA